MRINIIQGAFLPVPALRGGAVEKMWHRMGIEFSRAGHDVTHISRTFTSLANDEEVHGVRYLRVPGYDQPRNGAWLKFLDLLYSRRAIGVAPAADITVSNTFWCPILVKPHHGNVVVDVQRMPKGQLRLYDKAARLRANSSAVSNAMIHERPGVQDRIRIIPNPLTSSPAAVPSWQSRSKTLLYAGRIHPEKGIELLLEAWQRIRESPAVHDWKLQLIGPINAAGGGGGEQWWSEVGARFGFDNVEILPPVYDEFELNTHYAAARIFVYPSIAETGETFGSAILEAMSNGTPPLVSNLACFTDFVQPECNGFVFDHRENEPVSALAKSLLSTMAMDLSRQSRAAQKVNDTHSSSVIAQAFLEDFNSLANR